jgi:hypothetical protein
MAALTFTAGSVVLTGGATETLVAGGTLTRGLLVRKNASNQVVAASNDSAANADAYGISLSDVSSGQRAVVALLTGGGTLAGVATNGVAGHPVYGGSAGAINPMSDGASGQFITVIGVMPTGSTINLGKIAGGAAAASDIV